MWEKPNGKWGQFVKLRLARASNGRYHQIHMIPADPTTMQTSINQVKIKL